MLATQLSNDSAILELYLSPKFLKPHYKVHKNTKDKKKWISFDFHGSHRIQVTVGLVPFKMGDSTLHSDISISEVDACVLRWRLATNSGKALMRTSFSSGIRSGISCGQEQSPRQLVALTEAWWVGWWGPSAQLLLCHWW